MLLGGCNTRCASRILLRSTSHHIQPCVQRTLTTNTPPPSQSKQPPPTIPNNTNNNNNDTNIVTNNIPGIAAAIGVFGIGSLCADALGSVLLSLQGVQGASASPVSAVPIAILTGIAVSALLPLSKLFTPGLKVCTTTVLRCGIVCVGAKLSWIDMMALGANGIPAVIVTVGTGLVFVKWFGRFLSLPENITTLIAAGTSICGVTAITAVAPAINATQKDTSFAVANVVAFGTLGMLCYPYVAPLVLHSSHHIGMWMGLAIHDTSQVMGCALTYKEVFGDEAVLKTAAVTKLTRNVSLAAVVPVLTYLHQSSTGSSSNKRGSLSQYVPAFVIGFVLMSCFRSLGDWSMSLHENGMVLLVLSPDQWHTLVDLLTNKVAAFCLGTAMGAVGLSTHVASLRGVGPKPFVVGFCGAVVVATTGFICTSLTPEPKSAEN